MPQPDRPWHAYIAIFSPAFQIPPQAHVSIAFGVGLLSTCIYTTLLPNRNLRLLRMVLSAPAIYYFVDLGWASWYDRAHNRTTYLGLGTIALYGILRTLDTVWIRELDGNTPRWVERTRRGDGDVKRQDGDGKEARRTVADEFSIATLPLPTTNIDRLLYTFDFLTTVRGSSWLSDRCFDFAPVYAVNFVPPTGFNKLPFIASHLSYMLVQYLCIDVLDTWIKDRVWNRSIVTPVTSVPSFHLQLATSLAVCLSTVLYLTIPYSFQAVVFTCFGSSPTSWPPMVFDPLLSSSLKAFWGSGWHHIFRRTFNRMATAILWPIRRLSPHYLSIARKVCIFFLSMTLHVLLLSTLPPRPATPDNPYPRSHRTLMELGTMKFFLSQPLGLYIESAIVLPLARSVSTSPKIQRAATRIFAWCWLLWTGRWWADAWIGGGMYDESERPIVWSPVRGILRGTWII